MKIFWSYSFKKTFISGLFKQRQVQVYFLSQINASYLSLPYPSILSWVILKLKALPDAGQQYLWKQVLSSTALNNTTFFYLSPLASHADILYLFLFSQQPVKASR